MNPATSLHQTESPQEKIIVALDVDTAVEAESIVSELAGKVGAFKVGLQLFTAAGPEFRTKPGQHECPDFS